MRELLKKIIKNLAINTSIPFPRRFFGLVGNYVISSQRGVIVYFNDPSKYKIFDFIRKTKKETAMQVTDNEAYQIFATIKSLSKISGDVAEVGVYRGGSAKVICEAKGNKTLHLFDTFKGIPVVNTKIDDARFYVGQFATSIEGVKNYLKEYTNVFFYKGIFPDTAGPVKNNFFSFVNLDVDTHESTLNCLKFFYSRMNRGGVIISHDYSNAAGVKKAFDVFFEDKPESVIELVGSQCLVVKL